MPYRKARPTPVSANGTPPPRITPRWDTARRNLLLGNQLVKRFRVPAAMQECILAAFEEDGWPPRIDDPLSPDGRLRQTRQDRLHDVVEALNGHQLDARIHFYRDGTGQGVCWELPSAPPPRKRPATGKKGKGRRPKGGNEPFRPPPELP
jgi:hypothetical protein